MNMVEVELSYGPACDAKGRPLHEVYNIEAYHAKGRRWHNLRDLNRDQLDAIIKSHYDNNRRIDVNAEGWEEGPPIYGSEAYEAGGLEAIQVERELREG
jgi:hypothetical protein